MSGLLQFLYVNILVKLKLFQQKYTMKILRNNWNEKLFNDLLYKTTMTIKY